MPSLSAYLIISVISKIGKSLLLLRSSPSATRLREIVPTIFINQFNVRNHAVLNAFNQLSCAKFIYTKPIFCLLSISSSACLDGKISFIKSTQIMRLNMAPNGLPNPSGRMYFVNKLITYDTL